MSGFDDAVEGALEILKRRRRVSYEALRREFALDDDALDALRRELVDVLGAARDEGGALLVLREAPADAGDARAERRQLTVLACDLVGSTALSMRLDPEDLRELMRAYQTTCTRTIERHDGHVATWQGDGVFVLFGYPRAGEDDAPRAVRCGWEMVRALDPARERFKRRHGIRLAVRVGVHTGTTVVGDEGTTSEWQTHAFGDTPNIAARMASAAAPDTVVVSDAARRLTAGFFEFEPLGTVKLKGVSRPRELFRVVGPGRVHSRFGLSLGRGLAPLVGRARERAHLADAARRALGGERAAVVITGDPGIGKSRLAHHVSEGAAGALQRLSCECSPYLSGSALRPVVDELRRRWQLAGDTDSQLEALRAALAAYPRLSGARDLALMAALMDLPAPAGAPPLGSPQRRRAETLQALVALLREEARRKPLLLVIEDVHWVDPSTIELLSALLAGGRDVPMLILLTARPEFTPPWGAETGVEVLALDRLAPVESRELIRHVADEGELSADAVERLREQTEGVPLFVEEMTRAVLEAGGDGAATEAHGVPTTLYGCLMARLDRDRATLTVAQVGASIGRQFGRELLGLACDLDTATIDASLRGLVDAQLLDELAGPDRRFAFRHALIQQAAISSLLRSTEQRHHGRIADAILERDPGVADEQPEILAHHLERADRPSEAVAHWMRAGQRAVERSSNAEAILHLEHALELLERLDDDDDRARVELPLRVLAAVPLLLTRGWTAPAVEAHYRRAQELCARVGDTPELFPTQVGLVTYLIVSGQLDEARATGEANLELARRQGNADFELETEVDLGNTLFYAGRPREAVEHLERVEAIYDPSRHHAHAYRYGRDPGPVARLHRALALWSLDEPDAALDCLGAAEALLRERPHPFTEAWIQTGAAVLHLLRGDVEAVRRNAEAAIATSTVEGFPNWLAQANAYRGWALVAEGDERGLRQIADGLDLWRMTGAQLMVPWLGYVMADAQARCDRPGEAVTGLRHALARLAETGDRWCEPELMRRAAELELRAGETTREEAARQMRAAAMLAARRSARAFERRAAASLERITGNAAPAP